LAEGSIGETMTDDAILITGAAGFIGFHVAQHLLSAGREVVGLDSVNNYYDPRLKQARVDILKGHSHETSDVTGAVCAVVSGWVCPRRRSVRSDDGGL
jgi:nucleoside-diphosphate-sugar epimerase